MIREEIMVLKETKQNARMAIETIRTVMNKIYNEELAYELNHQVAQYKKIGQKAARAMKREGIKIKEDRKIDKIKRWSYLQGATLFNTSTNHVAELMVRGSAKSIGHLMKVTHNNKVKESYANELANELMDFQEKNIEKLKTYL